MTDIKFKFSKDSQRGQNNGGAPRQTEKNQRKEGRHQFDVTIDLKMGYLKTYSPPEGIDFVRYAVRDPFTKDIIPPFTKEYNQFHPVNCTFIASEVHPDPFARFTEMDLYNWLVKEFGKYITNWKLTPKEEPGLETLSLDGQLYFRHEAMMETNASTEQDKINKNMFNVRPKPILEHEVNWLNERLEIMGYKIKKSDALMATDKTINTPKKYFYEYGDF